MAAFDIIRRISLIGTSARQRGWDADRIATIACWSVILFAPLMLAFLAGFQRPFYEVFDADLYYIYNALAINDGRPQLTYDHTGYTYSLILAWWLRLADMLGLIAASGLGDVRNHLLPTEILSEIVTTGRVFSAVFATAFAAFFTVGIWKLTRLPSAAAALGAVLATTPSLMLHALILRPEGVSAFGVMAGFVFIALSRERAGWRPFFLLAAAAAAVYLGVLAKLQGMIPALVLPVFGFAWALYSPNARDGHDLPLPEKLIFIGLATMLFMPFATGHYIGVLKLNGDAGVPNYSWFVMAYITSIGVLFVTFRQSGVMFALLSVAAVFIGLGLAYLVNYFQFSLNNPGEMSRFLHNLKRHSSMHQSDYTVMADYLQLASLMWQGAFASTTAVFCQSSKMFVVQYLLLMIVVGIFFAGIKARAVHVTLSQLCLLFGALGTAAGFSLRYMAPFYPVYFDFMILLVIGIGLLSLPGYIIDRFRHAFTLLMLVVAALQFEYAHIQHVETPVHSAIYTKELFCEWQKVWAPILAPGVYDSTACIDTYTLPDYITDGRPRILPTD